MNRVNRSYAILILLLVGYFFNVVSAQITANPSTPVCSGSSVELTATGGTYYIWSTGATESSIMVNPVISTNYWVDVKDLFDVVIARYDIDVAVLPLPSVTISGDASVCTGKSVTLTASSSSAGGSFLWMDGSTNSTLTVSPSVDTSYWVEYTDVNGCKNTAYKTIHVNDLPNVSISGPTEICLGGSVTLVASGGVGFLWNDLLSTTSATLFLTPTTSKNYTCIVTDANGCQAQVSHFVTVAPALTPTISGINQICVGGNTILTASPEGATYQWNNDDNATTRSITVSPNVTTDYTVNVTKSGCTASATQTVTVNPKPTPQIAGQTTICRGGLTTLTASASEPGLYSYLWSTGATTAEISVSPLVTTTYSVTVTNQVTGCSNSTNQTVVVDASLAPTITGPTTVCSGSSITLTASPGSAYLWDDDGNSTSQSIIISPNSTRIYTVWVTNAAGCTDAATYTVTVTDAPGTGISGIHTICKGSSTTLTAPAGDSYSWSNGSTQPSITVSPLATTDYYVDVTKGTCVVRATQQVTVNDPVPATIGGLNSICGNASTGITLTASAGTSYLWSTGETTQIITVKPTASTVYSVTVTDNNGCTSSASHLVSVTPLPSLTISGVTTACVGASTTLTAVGGVAWSWSHGLGTNNSVAVNPSTTTTYTCDITDANGCVSTATHTLNVTSAAVPSITGNLLICKGGNTTLTSSAADSYLWMPGNITTASLNITGLNASTDYTLTVTQGVCTASKTVRVDVVDPPTDAVINGSDEVCEGSSVVLTAGGTATNYLWSTGETTQSITVTPTLASHSYYLTVTNNVAGCSQTVTKDITVKTKPAVSISGNPSVCSGESLTLTANGTGTFVWDDGTVGNTLTVTPTVSRNYTVTITNNGCTNTATKAITVNPLPVASVSGNTNICIGATTTLTATGGDSYFWTELGTSGAVVSVSPLVNTTYHVVVTNTTTGCQNTAAVTVNVHALPTPNITGTTTICAGQSTTLTATGGTSYLWNDGVTTAVRIVNPLVTTTYTVAVTNAAGCTASTSKQVTVNALPTPSITGPTVACKNSSVTLTAAGGDSYVWSTGETTQSITPIIYSTTTYTVTVKNANNCEATTTHTVTMNPAPTATIAGDLDICVGQTTTLTASGGASYKWLHGPTTASITVSPAATTTYEVEVTDANGCKSTATSTVVVNPLPTASITGDAEVCEGSSVQLTATGGVSYLWTPGNMTSQTVDVSPTVNTVYSVVVTGNGGCTATANHAVTVKQIVGLGISGATTSCAGEPVSLTASGGDSYVWDGGFGATATITVSPNVTTTYYVTISKNGCSKKLGHTITVTPKPTITITGKQDVCVGEATALTASGAQSYIWSNGVNTQTNTVTLMAVGSQIYTVTGTDANGCVNTLSVTVTAHAAPTATILGSTKTCKGTGVILTAGGTGTSYLWSTGETTQSIFVNPSATTNYTLTTMNAQGCSSSQAIHTLTVNDLPVVSISGPTVACKNSLVTLTATGGTNYLWSTGETTQSITPTITNNITYAVTVTDINGCTASTMHTINVIPEKAITITGDLEICAGETTTLTASGVPGGIYLWSNGQGGASITVNPSSETTYTVTVTDVDGCQSTASKTVKVNSLSAASITGGLDVCPGETITLTASAGQSWLWTPGNYTTQTISVTPTATTTYSVIITNTSGCTAITTHTVSLKSISAGTISGPTTSCAGETVVLTASGGSVLWSTGATTSSITVAPNATTTYYATITGANGCSSTKDHTITITPKPTVNIVGNTNICLGQSTTLTASGASSYAWDNGSIGQSIVISPTLTQTYVVTGTDVNGCTNTKSITVTVNPIPVASISGNNTICEGESTVLTATGGANYLWSTGATGATLTVSPSATTTYTVVATNASGCVSAVTPYAITVNPKPVASIAGVSEVCQGGVVTLTASGGTSYVWSTGETTQSITRVISATTLFTVTAQNSSGCTSTASHLVTANALPVASISGVLEICVGGSTTLTATGAGLGGTYTWNNAATGATITVNPTSDTEYIVIVRNAQGCEAEARQTVKVYPVPNPTVTGDTEICLGESATLTANTGTAWFWTPGGSTTQTITVSPSASTTYAVEVTGAGGCKATATHLLTIKSPVVGTVSGPTTSCAGETITLTANGGAVYKWDDNASDGATLVVSPLLTNTYYVTITGVNGCKTRMGHTITVSQKPTVGISGNTLVCKGSSTTLTASGGISYLWNTGNNTSTITVSPLVNTTYTVTVTDANGCTNTKSVDVTVNDIPTPNITGANVICEGSSTTLTASGGESYFWSTGATTTSINVNPIVTTTYTVVAKNGSCLSDPFPYTVTVNPKPVIGLTGDTKICAGSSATVTATGGDSYVWSNGMTGASITTGPLTSTTTLTVTATKGSCTSTAQHTIVVTPLPTITIYGSRDICAGEQTTLTATAGQAYLWSTGATTQTITMSPLADTNVSVIVTDVNNCQGQANVNIVVHPLPTPTITTNTGLTSVCSGTSITLTAFGGSTYLWETGERTASITVTPTTETTYKVHAFGDGGCSNLAQITISVIDLPTASISGPTTACQGDNISLTASAGTAWLWDNGSNTQTRVIITPPVGRTEYTVKVYNTAGCYAEANHAVVVNALPVASITGNNTICIGESTTLTAVGGDTYLWDDGSTGNTRTVTPAATQTYWVDVTRNGCTARAQVTVSVNALPTPTISGTSEICNGQSSLLTVHGGGSYYRWSTGQAGAAMSSILVSPTTTTLYEVEVTNASGCKNTAQFEVRVTQVSAPTISASKLTICEGEVLTLTSSAAPFYQWSANAGSQLNNQSVTVSPTETTTYTVTTTNNLGCISSSSITINVIKWPTPTISGVDKVCLGESTTLTASGGVTYRWSTGATSATISVSPTANTTYRVWATNAQGCENPIPASLSITVNPIPTVSILGPTRICLGQSTTLTATGGIGFLWSDGRTSQTITVSPSTTTIYRCVITNNNGCSAEAQLTLTVDPIPTPIVVGKTSICAGESTTLIASGGNSYEWSGGATGNNAMLTVTPTTTTTYTVKVTNANGCFATKDVTVVVNPLPVITIIGNTTVCAGGSTTLTASAADAVTYVWSNGGTRASTTVSPTTNTTYTVTVVTSSGCTATKSVSVIVADIPNPQISGATSVCSGTPVTLIASLVGGGSAAYTWNTGATTPSITVTPTTRTTYTVTATNAAGCQNSVAHTININALPIATITGPTIACDGQAVRLIASGAGTGGTYLWSNGLTTQDITVRPSITTTYEVTITNASGCVSKAQHTVNIDSKPNAKISGPTHICAGENATLIASGGVNYLWNTGATTASITVTPAASRTYQVTVKNAAGCDSIVNHTITVLPTPEPNITGDFIICLGESTTLTASAGYSTYSWFPGGETTRSIIVNPTTTTLYAVSVTNADGCLGRAQRTVLVNELPVASITADRTLVCEGGSATLTANGAGTGGSYRWSTGEVQQTIVLNNLLTNTTVSVIATNDDGCESLPVQQEIVVGSLPNPSITGGATVCQGGSIQLVATDPDPNVHFVWNNGTVGATLIVTTAGTYTVTATNAAGCTNSASKSVSVEPLPIASITASIVGTGASGEFICAGEAVRLSAFPEGDGYTYRWNTGATSREIVENPVTTTSYSVVVTSENGCSATASITIRVNEFVTITTASTDICINTPIILNSVGDNLIQFLWNTGETTPNIQIQQSVAGTYSYWVEAKNNKGCVSRATIEINVFSLPADLELIAPDSVCVNSSATLSIAGSVTSGTTYLWSPGGETTSSITVTPSVAGIQSYSCVVTIRGGCITTLTRDLKAKSLPEITIVGDNQICQGDTALLEVQCTNCEPGTTVLWSSGGSGATVRVTPNVTTNYTVTVRSPFGCVSTLNETVTVIPTPFPSITPNFTTACLDGSGHGDTDLVLAGTGTDRNGVPFASWRWSTSDNPTVVLGTTSVLTIPKGNVTSTKTYTLEVVTVEGCKGSTVLTIPISQKPTVFITGENQVCMGKPLVLVANATNATRYEWTTNESPIPFATTQTVTAWPTATANQIIVTVYNDANCSVQAFHSVTIMAVPVPTITPSHNPICAGDNVVLTASGGGEGAVYIWDDGSSNPTRTITSLASTTSYTVTVTNANGCVEQRNLTVVVNPLPNLSINGATEVCVGDSVLLIASDANGVANTYRWSSSSSTADRIWVKPTDVNNPTIYWVESTDVNICNSARKYHTIQAYSKPIAVVSGPRDLCAGESATLIASGGTKFEWSNNAQTSQITTPIYTTPGERIFWVDVYNEANCVTRDTVRINVAAKPSVFINVVSLKTTVCEDEAVILRANDAPAGKVYNYVWTNNTGEIISGSNAQQIIVNPTMTTTYYLTVVDDATGCTNRVSQVILVNPKPHVTLTSSLAGTNPIVCEGTSVTLSLSGTTAGLTYVWTCNNVVIATNVTTLTHTPTAPTNEYKVIVTNALGCSTGANELVFNMRVNLVPQPTLTLSVGSDTICAGDKIVLTANENQQSGYAYSWTSTNTADVLLPHANAKEITVYPINTATYNYTITDIVTGCSHVVSKRIVVNPRPQVTLSSSITGPNPTICEGSSVTLSLSGTTSGLTYVWTCNNVVIATNVTTLTHTPTASANEYKVIVTNASGCSTGANELVFNLTMTAIPLPTITLTEGSDTICAGDKIVLTANENQQIGYSYQWTSSTAFDDMQPNVYGEEITVYPTTTTSYTYTITDNVTGCSRSVFKRIVVNPRPQVTLSSSITGTNPTICEGQSVTLSVTGSNLTGLTYEWYGDNVLLPETSSSLTVIPSAGAHVYRAIVRSAAGCSVSSAGLPYSIQVTAVPMPTITATDANNNVLTGAVCPGAEVKLSGPLGLASDYAYLWTTNSGEIINNATQSNVTVNPLITTTYTLRITNTSTPAQCYREVTYDVLVNSVPTIAITSTANIVNGQSVICNTQQLSLVVKSTDGTTLSPTKYTFLWTTSTGVLIPGRTSSTITDIPSVTTTYTVTVTDRVTHCEVSLPHTVQVVTMPSDLAITATQSNPVCAGTTFKLTASYKDGLSYAWSDSQGNSLTSNGNELTITPTNTITYNVTITNLAGCSTILSYPVVVSPLPTLSISGPTLYCLGDVNSSFTLTASSNPSNADITWVYGNQTQTGSSLTITPSSAGLMTFTVTARNPITGCVSAGQLWAVSVVGIPENTDLTVTSSASGEACVNTTVTLSATAGYTLYNFGITDGVTYTVIQSSNLNTFSNLPRTQGTVTYFVDIYNQAGCKVRHELPVVVNPNPTGISIDALGANVYDETSFSAVICQGDSVVLQAQDAYAGNNTYIWMDTDGNVNNGQTWKVGPLLTSTYYLTVITRSGCSVTIPYEVKVVPMDNLQIFPSKTEICEGSGDRVVLRVTGATSGSYTWTSSQGLVWNNTSSITVYPETDGTDYVVTTISSVDNRCESRSTIHIEVVKVPNVTSVQIIPSGSTNICPGEQVTLTARSNYDSDGVLYRWSNGQIGNQITVIPNLTTTYWVIAANRLHCEDLSDTVSMTIVVYPQPVPQVTGDLLVYENQIGELTATGGIYYQWHDADGNLLSSSSIYNFNGLAQTTTYYLTAYGMNDCSVTVPITVTVIPFAATVSGITYICSGSSTVLTANGSPTEGYYYLWSTGSTAQSIVVFNPGTYTVRVTTPWGTSDAEQVIVGLSDTPRVRFGTPTPTCQGEADVDLPYTVLGGNPTNYSLTFDAASSAIGFIDVSNAILTPSYITFQAPSNVPLGTYSVNVVFTNAEGCESAIYTVMFAVHRDNMIVLMWDDVLICDNSSHEFVAYQWYKDNQRITGATLQYYSELGGFSGDYYVVAYNAAGVGIASCVMSLNTKTGMAVAPNPIKRNHMLRVGIPLTDEQLFGTSLEIFDAVGRLIYQSSEVNAENDILIQSPPGVYLIRVRTYEGTMFTEKFVVSQ